MLSAQQSVDEQVRLFDILRSLIWKWSPTMPLGNFVMAGGTPSILQVHHIDVTLVLGDREIKAVRADGQRSGIACDEDR